MSIPRPSRPLVPIFLLAILLAPALAESPGDAAPGAFLGVTLEPVSGAVRAALALEEGAGVLVGSVVGGSAAEEAGLIEGDVILRVNERPVRGPRELVRTVGDRKPGDTLDVEFWRGGRVQRVAVHLMRRPDDLSLPGARAQARQDGGSHLGITSVPLTDQLADYFLAPGGVLVTQVVPGSPADVAGLMAGDVIVAVGDSEVAAPSHIDFIAASRSESTILLAVVRNGADIFLEMALN